MKKCVFAGSFDPITLGHADLIVKCSGMFDEVVVAVLENHGKSPMFDMPTRVEMIEKTLKEIAPRLEGKVKAVSYDGLTVDLARREGAIALVRGIRDAGDYEYERQMSAVNHQLAPDIMTVFLPTDPALMHISSSYVKTLAHYGADIAEYVPACVIPYFEQD